VAINLSQERPGAAAEVADGFWIIATRHHSGGSHAFPEVNNRCLVFRVVAVGEPQLLAINGVDAAQVLARGEPEGGAKEERTARGVRGRAAIGGGRPLNACISGV